MAGTLQPEWGFIEAHGTRLYYEVAGRGHPLVLLHSGLLDHRSWDLQFMEFAQHYEVVRYDRRGFGRSAMGNVEYSDVRDLYDVLNDLAIDHAYLLGLSLGGRVAIDFALTYPEMVDALILAAANISGYDNYTPETRERGARIAAAARAGDKEQLYELWAKDPTMPQEDEYPEAAQRYRELLRDYSFVHYLNPAPRQPLKPPALQRLADIRQPTLILIGDADSLEMQAQADLLEAGIIDARKVVIHGAGHMLNLERPETFNRAVLTFLRSLERR
ncbi:alpha/beta fold hydrolase [Thermogemmatispora carboxidivorans]|uniref:alpha/beta fold hydrolase n=1 Tax=Thermogemmatispora carboxidivorans TaxID=1382306 RepID=UPI0006995F94|nr:alpha/beta hydrolase [Thermogemmatispora carboxidivorans]